MQSLCMQLQIKEIWRVESLVWQKTQSGACFGLAKTTKNNGPGPIERMLIPAKNGIFEPFIYIIDHFAKTGSGQT